MSRLQLLLLSGLVCFLSRAAISGERIDLTPDPEAEQLTHVSIQLEAGGHNLVRPQQQQDEKAAGPEQKHLPPAGLRTRRRGSRPAAST